MKSGNPTATEKNVLAYVGSTGIIFWYEDELDAHARNPRGKILPFSSYVLESMVQKNLLKYDYVASSAVYHVYVVAGKRFKTGRRRD